MRLQRKAPPLKRRPTTAAKVYRRSNENRMKIGEGTEMQGRKSLSGAILEFERAGLPRGLGGSFARFTYRCGRLGNFRALVQFHDARIGNLPAESLDAALLLV